MIDDLKRKLRAYYDQAVYNEVVEDMYRDPRVVTLVNASTEQGMEGVAHVSLQNLFLHQSDPHREQTDDGWFIDANGYVDEAIAKLAMDAVQEHTDKLKENRAPDFR